MRSDAFIHFYVAADESTSGWEFYCLFLNPLHIQVNTIKQTEIKEKARKEYFRRELFKSKLCSRNFIKGINTWAVPLVRYSGPFLIKEKRESPRNGPKDKEIDDDTQGLTLERLHRQTDLKKRRGKMIRQQCGLRRCLNTRTRGINLKGLKREKKE